MTIVLIVAGVLVLAYLLYLGNRSRQERRLEAERERAALEQQAEGHRSMAADHEAKAEELREEAERVEERADRHKQRAAEVDPEIQTQADARE